MNSTVVLGLALIKDLVEIIVEAIQGKPVPTPDELRAKIKAALDAHDDEWLKNAIEDADELFD